MEVTPLAATLGAEVKGIDVRELDEQRWQQLNAWFLEHQVLVFRNQDLHPEEHMAFAQRWGQLVRHPYAGLKDYPDIIELKNLGKRRDINQHWHSDMTYNPAPPKLTMLYARSAPDIGGDTAFANQYLAYANLSENLKSMLMTLQAEHSAQGLATQYGKTGEGAPRATHPVVRTHDESGRLALYVCRAFTERFSGWTRTESAGLLGTLFDHSVRPEYQARHSWQAGDLVMWDNRCLLHFAVHDHADDQPRLIHRVQVEGPVPT